MSRGDLGPLRIEHVEHGKAVVRMSRTMWACIYYSILAVVLLVCFYALGGIGPRFKSVNHDEVWHAGAAVLLIFSSMVTEACLLVANSCNEQLSAYIQFSGKSVTLPGVGDPILTLLEYLTKFVCGMYIWLAAGGIMHTDALAYGEARPVYLARFAQWSVAVPILVLITNKAFIVSAGDLMWRSWPSVTTAFLYVWVAWLMEVTTVHWARWPLMILSMSGAVVFSIDQICLAKEYKGAKAYSWKVGMLTYQISSFVLYAGVFLLGRFGVISSVSEQIFYAYTDATVKVLQGAMLAMIRQREAAIEICHWWTAASTASKDLQDLLHQARVPTLSIDLSGVITDWNASITELTGLSKEEATDRLLVDLCSGGCKEELRKELDQRLTGFAKATQSEEKDKSFKENFPMIELSIPMQQDSKPTPACRILAMMFVPKHDPAGQLEGAMAIGQDLSELAEMKLVQERKHALAAMISHEFRSPLHGIMGLIGLIMEAPACQSMSRQLGMVKGCASRLLDLVTDVMILAENEKRKSEGVSEGKPSIPVDFGHLIDEATCMISNSVDKANKPILRPGVCIVNKCVGARLPLIPGDPYKCTQVIYNLLTNSCKFTDRGSITISHVHAKQQKLLQVSIADTGKGISEEAMSRIWKPFEQESSKDVRSFQGIGLGLAVCKDIVTNHGGTVDVKSIAGQGSVFTVSFPCPGDLGLGVEVQEIAKSRINEKEKPIGQKICNGVQIEKKADGSTVSPSMPSSELKSQSILKPGKPPLVLSVDDDEVNQEVIKKALAGTCDIVQLMDGFETMKYLQQVQNSERPCPDLVLLDIQMPGMTGFEVCDAIRNTFALLPGKLPVTMVSAKYPSDAAAIEAFDAGSTDFVAKPFNPDVLKRKVTAALKIKQTVGLPCSAYVMGQEARKMLQAQEDAAKAASQELEASKEEGRQMHNKVQALQEEVERLKTDADSHTSLHDQVSNMHRELDQHKSASTKSHEEMRQLREELDAKNDQIALLQQQLQAASMQKWTPDNAAPKRLEPSDRVQRHLTSVVRLLCSRLQLSSGIARQCRDLLSSLAPTMTSDMANSKEGQLQAQLEDFKVCSKVVSAELATLEQVASNIDTITSISALAPDSD